MKILNVTQGSQEWLSARMGLVTASEIDALVSPLGKVRTGEGVKTYLWRKIAEKIMNYSPDSGGTFAMNQGSLLEKTALPWFEFAHNMQVDRVGFCVSDCGRYGCSPDGMIGEESGLELKCPMPPKHLEYLAGGVVPADYIMQVQMSMFVTGRPRWIFCSYSSYLPKLVLTVERDDEAQKAIDAALNLFLSQFDAAHARLQAMMATGGRQ